MVPMFLLLIASDCLLTEELPSTELQQMNAIVKKLEAKIERQDVVINELRSLVRRDMSELAERMETKANRTEEELEAIRDDTKLLSAT